MNDEYKEASDLLEKAIDDNKLSLDEEKKIAKYGDLAVSYACDVINKRFKLGEEAISNLSPEGI